MRLKSFDLVMAMVVTTAAVISTLVGTGNAGIRVILALPLVLVLPGYVLAAAMFPSHTWDIAERLTISLGLSLAVAVLSGFVLNWTPGGLQADSWAVWLGSVSLVGGWIALVRRERDARKGSATIQARLHIKLSQVLLFGLAALAAVGAIWVARSGAARQSSPGFTQLWILPANASSPSAVHLGVRNMEPEAMRYRLQVEVGTDVVGRWSSIELEPGQGWQTMVVLPIDPEARNVEAKLYRLDIPEMPYRSVVLWLDD